jgi:hypothetical protein
MANGGSLTINPETGLPEAGFLDKLLPTIIGAGLTFFSGGAINPMMAAGIVGGIQTARTGDIGKGISAGLGAYGGAGLGAGLTTAGAGAIGSEAAGQSYLASAPGVLEGAGAGLSADMAANLTDAGVNSVGADAARQAAAGAVEAASPFDKMSRGFDAAKANPSSLLTKDNFKYLGAAAAPILADQAVTAKGPQTVTRPGQIAPSEYDPYSGTFIRANPYEAQVKRAADGGLMAMNNGGYSPGQLDFAQRSEPVVRMAGGGVSDAQVVDWFKANAGADDKAIAAAMQQYGVDPTQVARATGTEDKLADYETRYQTATNQNVLDFADQSGALSTATQGGTGTAGIADWMDKSGIDAQEYARALESRFGPASAGSAKNPYTAQGIQALYDNASMVGNQADIINAASPIKDIHDTRNDKTWVDWMDKNGIDVSEAARSFGLSTEETQARYDAAKKPPVKPPITFKNPVTGGTITAPTRTTTTVLPTDPTVNAPPGTKNPYGGPNTPGDKTYNPDGSITVTPNIPGRPYGGFSGIKEVKDAYTAGGGSLGYIPYAPKTIEEFDKKYNTQTGGSKQAYDYLMGKTPYSPTPYTPTGEIMKPYFESVAGMPSNPSKKMYLFDPATKQYKINPDYAIPTYDSKGKKTYNLTNRDVSAYLEGKPSGADFYTWAKTNNLSVEQIAAATGMPITEIQKMFSGGKPKDEATPTTSTNDDVVAGGGDANGGLMKLAEGGATGAGGINLHIPLTVGNEQGGGQPGLGGGAYTSGGGGGGDVGLFGGGIPSGATGTTGGFDDSPKPLVFPAQHGGDFGHHLFEHHGFADRPDETGGLYKGGFAPKYDPAVGGVQMLGETPPGLDDTMTPGIMAGNAANQAKNAAAQANAKANPASMADLAKRLGISMATGGITGYATGGQFDLGGYSDGGRLLRGPGDGVSDSIPASIGNKRPARLADGEFVIPARIVSELGNGSTEAGARKLYAMMDRVQAARKGSIGKGKVAKNSRADKHLPA